MTDFNTHTTPKFEFAKGDRGRAAIRQVLLRHRGSMAQIARELGIDPVNVSNYLTGFSRSGRVADAVRKRAHELLREESMASVSTRRKEGSNAERATA